MTSAYLSKYFNFISSYDCHFSNFNSDRCLCSNTIKYLNIIHKSFLKNASKLDVAISARGVGVGAGA